MERVENPEFAHENSTSGSNAADSNVIAASPTSPASTEQSAPSPPNARTHSEPEERAKRTKHSRVQKREQELYGLVTPVFLPLLDARDTSPKQQKSQPALRHSEEAQGTPSLEQTAPPRDAEKSKEARKSRREHKDMEVAMTEETGKETQHVDAPKKSKRSAIKKSSLRQHSTARSRRKRVSLVIDGQTVLPADTVIEPPLTSPSETPSTSNSTTSLDEMIDPRLTSNDPLAPVQTEHYEAVHHSLPLPMSNTHSPTKPLIETPTELSTTPPTVRSPRSPIAPVMPFGYNPPSTALHTFLDHPSSLQPSAGPDPIYADDLELKEEREENDAFSTYVGGIHGSGVDNLDQAGSYGYPSSLGASYLESYMQSRPLRVRMEAADKAGLSEEEKKAILTAGDKEKSRHEDVDDEEFGMDVDKDHGRRVHAHDDDEMDIVGSMEGF